MVRLEDVGQNLLSFLFNKGFRNSVIINPLRATEGMPLHDIWEHSNTIPGMKFFSKLGTKLIANNSLMASKRRFSLDPPQDSNKRS